MKDKKENKKNNKQKLLSPKEILNLSDSFGLNLDIQGGSTKENLVILSELLFISSSVSFKFFFHSFNLFSQNSFFGFNFSFSFS